MRIRQASPQDAQGLAEVHALSWQAAYAGLIDPQFLKTRTLQRSLETFKRNGCAEIWLAEQADKIVGFCRIGREEDNGELLGEIVALYLLPQFQRQGIGKRLMQTGIDSCGSAAIPHLFCGFSSRMSRRLPVLRTLGGLRPSLWKRRQTCGYAA